MRTQNITREMGGKFEKGNNLDTKRTSEENKCKRNKVRQQVVTDGEYHEGTFHTRDHERTITQLSWDGQVLIVTPKHYVSTHLSRFYPSSFIVP